MLANRLTQSKTLSTIRTLTPNPDPILNSLGNRNGKLWQTVTRRNSSSIVMGDGSSTMNSMTSSYLSVAARSIRSEVAIGTCGSEENSPNLSSTSSAAASDASSTVSNHSLALSSSVDGGTPNNKDGDRDEKEGSITPVGADLSELHTHKLSAG